MDKRLGINEEISIKILISNNLFFFYFDNQVLRIYTDDQMDYTSRTIWYDQAPYSKLL